MKEKKASEQATDQTFEAIVLNSDLPVLVDFWAPWCRPCHAIAPAFETLAQEYAGRIRFVKMNVDKSQRTAMALNVLNIPSIILFVKGKLILKQVGLQSKASVSAMIDQWLLQNPERRAS